MQSRIHLATSGDKIAGHHADVVAEVERAIAAHDVVVVGMKGNPFPRRARKALSAAGAPHQAPVRSYFAEWRRRNALKMWTGWPTFPMVFVKGAWSGARAISTS